MVEQTFVACLLGCFSDVAEVSKLFRVSPTFLKECLISVIQKRVYKLDRVYSVPVLQAHLVLLSENLHQLCINLLCFV